MSANLSWFKPTCFLKSLILLPNLTLSPTIEISFVYIIMYVIIFVNSLLELFTFYYDQQYLSLCNRLAAAWRVQFYKNDFVHYNFANEIKISLG
jgi:hypothetical protein